MPAMTFSQFDALPDALLTDRFQILLSPSSSPNVNQILALRCTQIALPQEMIEVMTVAIGGMEFNFRGRHVFDKKIQASFVETSDASVTNSIATWMQAIVGSETGNGQTKSAYATTGTINLFNQQGIISHQYIVDNMWPDDNAQVQLDGGQGTSPFIKQIGFTYDRFQLANVTPL